MEVGGVQGGAAAGGGVGNTEGQLDGRRVSVVQEGGLTDLFEHVLDGLVEFMDEMSQFFCCNCEFD